jgi:hypothetical protein
LLLLKRILATRLNTSADTDFITITKIGKLDEGIAREKKTAPITKPSSPALYSHGLINAAIETQL